VKTSKAYGYVWTPVLYFSTITKLILVLVKHTMKPSKPIAVRRNVMILKPLLDPGFESVTRWISRTSEVCCHFVKHANVWKGQVRAVRWARM